MDREALLSKLSIRLSHLAEAANADLDKQLEALRLSLRGGINEEELHRISERLARHVIMEDSGTKPRGSTFTAAIADHVRDLALDAPHRAQLAGLADRMVAADHLDGQLQILNEVFQVIKRAGAAPAPVAAKKKAAGGGLLGWLDKKAEPDKQQLDLFLEKSTRLIDQAIQHIDVLNGNSKDTSGLKQQLEQPGSVQSLGAALEEVIKLLQEHSLRIEAERVTTQDFLTDLRERLGSVESAVSTILTDGEQSLERAEQLEQSVGEDVRSIGEAAQADDLDFLKQTVESGLTTLSDRLASYLQTEKHSHKESRQRVEELNQKLRAMEEEAAQLRGQIKDKQDLAVKDALTGVYNRAGYEQRIGEELARSARSNAPLSLVFVDCNKFKYINDTYGHGAGDVVLVQVAQALANRARASDIVARFGGDEFVAVLPDTPVEGAQFFATDACRKILDAGFHANGEPLDVSISCGVTQARDGDTPDTLLKRADEAMYKAKKAPAPQVVVG